MVVKLMMMTITDVRALCQQCDEQSTKKALTLVGRFGRVRSHRVSSAGTLNGMMGQEMLVVVVLVAEELVLVAVAVVVQKMMHVLPGASAWRFVSLGSQG